jgi:hypothetical protein
MIRNGGVGHSPVTGDHHHARSVTREGDGQWPTT